MSDPAILSVNKLAWLVLRFLDHQLRIAMCLKCDIWACLEIWDLAQNLMLFSRARPPASKGENLLKAVALDRFLQKYEETYCIMNMNFYQLGFSIFSSFQASNF